MSGGIVGVSTPDPGTNALIQRLANPPNPLATLGPQVEAIDALKSLQAKNALTGIYQQSIDPATGQVDLGKFNALASQNPAALYNFGETMRSSGAGVGAQGQGTSAAVQAQLDQLAVQQAYMTPLLAGAKAGTLTAQDVQGALKNVPPGVISPTSAANISQALASGADPNQLVLGGFFASEHARQIAGATAPNYFGYGGGALNVAPLSPGSQAPSRMPYTPSPEAQISYQEFLKHPYDWYDPKTLQYTQGTYEQFLNARGANPTLQWAGPPPPQQQPQGAPGEPSGKIEPPPPAPAGSGGGAPGAAPAPAAPPAAGAPPPPVPRGAAPTGAPAPSAGAAPAPAVPAPGAAGSPATLPPPKTIESSTDAYNTAQADQADSAARVATMQRALTAAKGAPIGPGTEGINTIRGIVGNFTPDFLQRVMPGDTSYEKSTDYQVLHKYLQGIANANTAAFGGSATNDKLAATVAANPNTNMNTASVDEVLKVMIAGEHANQYIWKAAENQNIAPAAFGKFRADWMNTHDIRAFAVNDLDPKARQQLYAETHNAQGKLNAAGTRFNNTIHELTTNNALPEASSPEPEPGQD